MKPKTPKKRTGLPKQVIASIRTAVKAGAASKKAAEPPRDAEGRLLRADGKPRRLFIVDVKGPPVEPMPTTGAFVDSQGRLVALVDTVDGSALYIQRLGTYKLMSLSAVEFHQAYRPLRDDPTACDRFLRPIAEVGAPPDVLKYVGAVSTLTKEQLTQAEETQTQKQLEFKERIAMAKAKKAGSGGSGSNGAAKKAAAPKKEPGEKKATAAALFQTLIMEGAKTDDQIFAVVKAKFGLDDKKRSYVAWYRNHLKKTGQKPPEAKEVKA